MKLEYPKVFHRNDIYNKLIKADQAFLERNSVNKCKGCKGTGLTNVSSQTFKGLTITSWSGDDYCDDCQGYGYTGVVGRGIEIEDGQHLCRECDGAGCIMCNAKGLVDSFAHAMGR